MFSQHFKYLLEKLQFLFIVIVRFVKVLFRWRKNIELLYLDYSKEHLFENSYIIINYRFRNALWYRFSNHNTLEKQIKIFDLKNLEKDFNLIVYGFFRKKVYKLQIEPQLRLDNSNFKTLFSNLTLKLQEQLVSKLQHPSIYLAINKPIIKVPKIEIKSTTIKIKASTYNQNEFI